MDQTDDERLAKGVVFETLSDGRLAVEARNGAIFLVKLSGRLKRRKTKVVPGDSVEVRLLGPSFTSGYLTARL